MAEPTASAKMLARLRRQLRAEGWTIALLASELEVAASTVKRWMGGKALTLDRLEQMAALVDLSLADLVRDFELNPVRLARELTLAQERALSADIFLAFLFYTILRGIPAEETARDFRVPDAAMAEALLKLERLALIDRTRGGRIRPLVDRLAVFKLPMRGMFELHVKPQFMELDFTDAETAFSAELVKLSPVGAAKLAELVEKYRQEVLSMAEDDIERTVLGRTWYGTLCVMRRIDTSPLNEALAKG